jgi:hypothetical protein
VVDGITLRGARVTTTLQSTLFKLDKRSRAVIPVDASIRTSSSSPIAISERDTSNILGLYLPEFDPDHPQWFERDLSAMAIVYGGSIRYYRADLYMFWNPQATIIDTSAEYNIYDIDLSWPRSSAPGVSWSKATVSVIAEPCGQWNLVAEGVVISEAELNRKEIENALIASVMDFSSLEEVLGIYDPKVHGNNVVFSVEMPADVSYDASGDAKVAEARDKFLDLAL